jgi:hypothetical protein
VSRPRGIEKTPPLATARAGSDRRPSAGRPDRTGAVPGSPTARRSAARTAPPSAERLLEQLATERSAEPAGGDGQRPAAAPRRAIFTPTHAPITSGLLAITANSRCGSGGRSTPAEPGSAQAAFIGHRGLMPAARKPQRAVHSQRRAHPAQASPREGPKSRGGVVMVRPHCQGRLRGTLRPSAEPMKAEPRPAVAAPAASSEVNVVEVRMLGTATHVRFRPRCAVRASAAVGRGVSVGPALRGGVSPLGTLDVDADALLWEAQQPPDGVGVVEGLRVGPYQVLVVSVGQPE